MIQTRSGRIITTGYHKGNIYLRGILLVEDSDFEYGYDLPEGKTNRDREQIRENKKGEPEALTMEKLITRIWAHAIVLDEKCMANYCDLLLADLEDLKQDVRDAEKQLSGDSLLHVWNFLKRRASEQSQFYYCEGRERDVSNGILLRLRVHG
jgi:hypothetical protein